MERRSSQGLLDDAWVGVQAKVFSRWCTKQLKPRGMEVSDVRQDFSDGVKLLNLLEVAGKEPIPQRWHKEVKGVRARYQALENAQAAISYIQNVKKIRLVGIQSEHIVDKNPKMTLGLIWSCINKFVIDEISVEEATARDALLIWCRKNTAGYQGVNIQDFTKSWVSGLAFCALLNKFRPALLDYSALDPDSTDKNDYLANTTNAFNGYQTLGIACLLDPPDVVGPITDPFYAPDDKSIVTQVSELYHYFASETKAQAQADKLKKVLQIQKQIESLTSNYEDEARATIDGIDAADRKLVDPTYARTVQGVRAKLSEVIQYAHGERPNIIQLRAKALRTWGALATKVKTAGRPIPVPPQGLEPDTLNAKFAALEATDERRTGELTEELRQTEQALIDAFDGAAAEIVNQCQAIRADSGALAGELSEQLDALLGLLEQVNGLFEETRALQRPNRELVELGLNTRAKYTIFNVESEVQQLAAHLKHLIEQNKGAQFEASNRARIAGYNAQALPYLQEAEDFDLSVSGITGDLVTRRTILIEKQADLMVRREGAQVLILPFQDLEKDGLHLEVENTPGKITGIYGRILNRITEDLQQIYAEMVANFDAAAQAILDKVAASRNSADSAAGSDEEIRDLYVANIAFAEPIQNEVPELQPDFDELVEFKLNFKVKATVADVASELELLLSHLRHLLQSKEGEIALKLRTARIEGYKAKAQTYVDSSRVLEAEIQAVEEAFSGTLQDKLGVYNAKQEKVKQFQGTIDALVPDYEALVQDDLHLEIEHTPASIVAFIDNLDAHIVTLIQAIDQAIAREKGLQIPEEQLAEFRETFNHFDKEKNKLLEPYQLNACLTSLGEPTDDNECAQIIRQYMKNPAAKGIDFDGYVAFMLDRFSKAETNETTRGAFQTISGNQPAISDDQIDKWFAPEDAEYLKSRIPSNGAGAYDYGAYVDSIFA